MTGRRSHGRLSALNGVVHQGNRWTVACAHCGTFQIAGALTRAFDTACTAGWRDGQAFLADLSPLTRAAHEPLYSRRRAG